MGGKGIACHELRYTHSTTSLRSHSGDIEGLRGRDGSVQSLVEALPGAVVRVFQTNVAMDVLDRAVSAIQ